MDAQADVNADFIICKSEKTDPWDNPYFVIIDSAERGGSTASEFYITTVSAGPNAILNLTAGIDRDDLFELSSYVDGDVISKTYNIADAAPTKVGGAAAATSYTDPAAAPVNNGETTEFGAVSLISFTISGVEYQAEEGMTWYEWCNTEYKTDGWTCYSLTSEISNDGWALSNPGVMSGSPIGSDEIIQNGTYSKMRG